MGNDALTADVIAAAAREAAGRIRGYIRETPLEYAHALSSEVGARIWLKLDNTQVSGSFKARGAFNALLCLTQEQRDAGVFTSSTGNHANAMAVAMAALGVDGEIVVPSTASPAKLDALRAKGAPLRLVDADPGEAEAMARADAEAS